MKAAICRTFGAPLVIEDVVLLPPGPGQIEVKVAACAICHSDIAFADGAWGGALPSVLGHEAMGHVTRCGQGVEGIAPGTPALVTLIRHCGACPACATEAPTSCAHAWDAAPSPLRDGAGATLTQGMNTGAFAERVVVDQSQVVPLPPGLDPAAASLLACGVLTGVGAVANSAALRPGQSCAIVGAGGVGLNTIQGAAIAGAEIIVALDVTDARLARAKAFGATHVLRADDPGHAAAVRDLTGGRGVDFAFVATGAPAAFERAPELLAAGGAVVIVGMPPNGTRVGYEPTALAAMNQRVLGSRMGQSVPARDVPRLLEHVTQGRLQLDPLISGRYPLERINDAIASARQGAALRNVIVFEEV